MQVPENNFNAMSLFPTLLQLAEKRRAEQAETQGYQGALEGFTELSPEQKNMLRGLGPTHGPAILNQFLSQSAARKKQEEAQRERDLNMESQNLVADIDQSMLANQQTPIAPNLVGAEEEAAFMGQAPMAPQKRTDALRAEIDSRVGNMAQLKRQAIMRNPDAFKGMLSPEQFGGVLGYGKQSDSPEFKLLADIYGQDAVSKMQPEDKIANLGKIKSSVMGAVEGARQASRPVDPLKNRTPDERRVMRLLMSSGKPFDENDIQAGTTALLKEKDLFKNELVRKRSLELAQVRENTLMKFADARAAAMAKYGLNAVYDENMGEFRFASREDIKKDPALKPAAQSEKSANKQAIYGEIKVSIQNVRDALQKMPDEFELEDMVQIGKVLKATTKDQAQNVAGIMFDSAWMKSLSPEKQDYVISLVNAYESLLALRTIQGVGQASETTRAAMMSMAPSGLTPSKQYANKQLDRVEAELEALGRGIIPVKMPKGSAYEKTGTPPPATGAVIPRKPGESIADYLTRTRRPNP